MAQTLHLSDGDHGYVTLVNIVADQGRHVSPRGMATRELEHVTIIIDDPVTAVPVNTSRRLKYAIGATETMHLIGGISSLEQLDAASANRFRQFSDDGRLQGAYGPRVYAQLPKIIRLLATESDSRQGVVMIFKEDDLLSGNADVPCTVYLHFRVIDGALELKTTMRSNDVWLGVPYDWWMFTRLQMTVAWALKLPLGPYTHHVDSLHLYERDVDIASRLERLNTMIKYPPAMTTNFQQRTVRDGPDSLERRFWSAGRMARSVCFPGIFSTTASGFDETVSWYRAHVPQLAHDGFTLCELGCRYVLPDTEFDTKRTCRGCKTRRTTEWYQRRQNDALVKLGITDSKAILAERQDDRCAVCGEVPESLCVDHDHVTNSYRGLICHPCNLGLGLFKDDVSRLRGAIRYLEDHELGRQET